MAIRFLKSFPNCHEDLRSDTEVESNWLLKAFDSPFHLSTNTVLHWPGSSTDEVSSESFGSHLYDQKQCPAATPKDNSENHIQLLGTPNLWEEAFLTRLLRVTCVSLSVVEALPLHLGRDTAEQINS